MILLENKKILATIISIAIIVIGIEIHFYWVSFDHLLKDRVFLFTKPDYVNYWLMVYVFFSLLFRFFGLIRLSYDNKKGFYEFSFGQLMFIALLYKEFFRYSFYVYVKNSIETKNLETLFFILLLFCIEIGILIYFYFVSRKMIEA